MYGHDYPAYKKLTLVGLLPPIDRFFASVAVILLIINIFRNLIQSKVALAIYIVHNIVDC
jgi:hypothetical protein